jgi:hypothetical protein
MLRIKWLALAFAGASALSQPAGAVSFTTSYTDGGSWGESGLYAQGFNPFVDAEPIPGIAEGEPVYLTNFRFFKSGLADSASNIRLAIVNNIFLNLQGLTADPVASPAFVGISTNAISSTASLATGDPFDFQFNGLPLMFGEFDNYAAIFVNVGPANELTPVLVSTLRANYVETPPGSGTFLPQTNYGDIDPLAPLNDRLACSNFTHSDDFGRFFDVFFGYADANFVATFSTTPPSMPGDYDGDGNVDGDDLTKSKAEFGQTATLGADGDGDGDVDGNDYLIWQRNLGAGQPVAGLATATPEPNGLALGFCAAAASARASRQRGRRWAAKRRGRERFIVA